MHSQNKPHAVEPIARLEYLEELRLKMLDALESIAESGGFRQSPDNFQGPVAVLRDAAQRVMFLAPFQAAALWLVDETTSDFILGWCDPEDRRTSMAEEFEQLTREGIIALAVNGERPVMAAGTAPQLRYVVQVLTTPSRVRGLLLAQIKIGESLPDGTLHLVNILCQGAAALLEGLELYRLLREKNQTLQEEIETRRVVQARQELLSQAFCSSLEGMLVIDASGRILEANQAVQALTRRAPEALVGRYAHTILSQVGARRHFRTILREIVAHGRFKGEIRGCDREHGDFFLWLSVNAVRDKNGSVNQYVAVLHAIAGRQELEAALMQAELKYRDIFENAPVAIFRTTLDGRILDVNQSYAEMLGYGSPEEIVHAVSDIGSQLYVEPRERETYTRTLLEKESVRDYEVRLRRRDGQMVLVSMNTRVIKDTNGRPVSLNGFMRDITSEKIAEEEKERLQKQLHQAQKLQSVGRLAGGVAHDFNNMLGVIIGQAQLALMKISAGDPIKPRLQEIEKAAQRSADLVSQLLAFARKQTIVPRFVDLNETITGMLNMLERLVGENIKLLWEPGDDLWPVKIDPSQVDQLLINLVVNAQHAISGAGVVTIATRNVALAEPLRLRQEDLPAGEHVLLTVSDTGCGMDLETQGQIFEPFFTTKDVGQGTGLGLATVYGIVKQNNGMVTFSSEPEHGSVFSMYFPRLSGGVQEQIAVSAGATIQGGTARVLIVEDEASLLAFIGETLAQLGYAVLTAQSPWEAIHQVQSLSRHIDLLITDVVMPEMNGRELASRLRALEPGLKCLFISGYTRDVIAHHGVLDEGLCFLHKPFTMRELAQKVHTVLQHECVAG
jgi:PAS domain S-box-containing protein